MSKLLKKLFEYNVIQGGGTYDTYHKRLVNLGNFIWNGNYYKAGLKQQANISDLKSFTNSLLHKKYVLNGTGSNDPSSPDYDATNRNKVIQVKLADDNTEGGHPVVDPAFVYTPGKDDSRKPGIANRVLPFLVSPKITNGLPEELTTTVGIVEAMKFFSEDTSYDPKIIPHNKKDRPGVAQVGSVKGNLSR